MMLDEDEIVNEKMNKNEARYPVDKARGRLLILFLSSIFLSGI